MCTSSESNKGEAPDAGELLVAALGIAGLTKTLQERAAALQDQTARTFHQIEAMGDELRQRQEAQMQDMRQRFHAHAQDIRRTYSVEAVQNAVDGAFQVLGEFRDDAAQATDDFKRKLDAATKLMSSRIAGITAMSLVLLLLGVLCAVGFSGYYFSHSDEVSAGVAGMATREMRPVQYKGGEWVPVADVQELCEQNDPKRCRQYGRIR